MSNQNSNQTITVTKKCVAIMALIIVVLFTLSVISLILALSNSDKLSSHYQLVATHFNELESKVNASNTLQDNIAALEQRINHVELEQKKITLDYDNLNTRTALHEQDIVLLPTIVNDKNLDSRLDNMEVSIKNSEIDIDSLKTVQRSQQITLDDIAKAFNDFKSHIIQKVTSMLTSKKTGTPHLTSSSQGSQVSNVNNFPYTLSSIEYRSGDTWAVFAPKNIQSLSQLKFVNSGNKIDNWTVSHIDTQSVKLVNGRQVFTLSLSH